MIANRRISVSIRAYYATVDLCNRLCSNFQSSWDSICWPDSAQLLFFFNENLKRNHRFSIGLYVLHCIYFKNCSLSLSRSKITFRILIYFRNYSTTKKSPMTKAVFCVDWEHFVYLISKKKTSKTSTTFKKRTFFNLKTQFSKLFLY